jgi:hypothetical protein
MKKRMTKATLIEHLLEISKLDDDTEQEHMDADGLLLEFINDKKVTEAYNKIYKWYA